ncbi:MAG: hypothetical protein ACRCZ9_12170 [Fusobacteriaceae bacterium]
MAKSKIAKALDSAIASAKHVIKNESKYDVVVECDIIRHTKNNLKFEVLAENEDAAKEEVMKVVRDTQSINDILKHHTTGEKLVLSGEECIVENTLDVVMDASFSFGDVEFSVDWEQNQ